MTPAVRPGRGDDLPALLDLWEASWAAAMPTIDFAARREWFAVHLGALQRAGAALLVAEGESGPVGFITVDPATCVVDQLAVAPAAQGRSVGSFLIREAKSLCPRGLSLTVNRANDRAKAFYDRHGFRAVGEGRNARSGLPVLHLRWAPDAGP